MIKVLCTLGKPNTENILADYSLVQLVLNLFIIVLCGFVNFYNGWGCVRVGSVLYGCVRLM